MFKYSLLLKKATPDCILVVLLSGVYVQLFQHNDLLILDSVILEVFGNSGHQHDDNEVAYIAFGVGYTN